MRPSPNLLPEEIASEEQLQITSPPGHSWWPVIALQTVAVSQFLKKIFIVCFLSASYLWPRHWMVDLCSCLSHCIAKATGVSSVASNVLLLVNMMCLVCSLSYLIDHSTLTAFGCLAVLPCETSGVVVL